MTIPEYVSIPAVLDFHRTDSTLSDRRNDMETNDRRSALKKLSAKILEWDDQIEAFRKKAEASSADVKKDLERAAGELAQKKKEAEARLREFEESASEGWEELKTGADKAVSAMNDAIEKAKEKFLKRG